MPPEGGRTPSVTVAAEIFDLRIEQPVRTAAEIAELRWVDPAEPAGIALAPLTRDHILPMAVGAIAMSLSTIVVALNAQLLRRVRLRPRGAPPAAQLAPA